jgi:hypothetical protein
MTDTPRLYGKLPAVFPAIIKDIEHYFAGDLPKAPAKVDVTPDVPWGMDGNADYGDCGVAGIKHGFQNAALVTSEKESFPTDQQVVDYYLKYTGGQDNGVVLSDFLKYVETNKFYDHTVSAYAPVNFKDIPNLQFAIWAYTFAYTGIVVTPAMQDAFSNGQPWTLDVCLGQPEGGHCIPLVGYDSQYLYAVTWGAVQPIAYSAWAHIADESWAVITGEVANGDAHGLNLQALQSDISKLN